jgi:hypothetical protein
MINFDDSNEEKARRNLKGNILVIINQMPLFTRIMIITCAIMCLWSVQNTDLKHILANDHYAVIYYKEWYRMITATFISDAFIKFLIEIALFYTESVEYEQERTPMMSFLSFIWKNCVINITLVGVETILYWKQYDNIVWGNCGLMAITLTYITERTLKQPLTYKQFFLFSQPIRNIYYLVIIFGFSCFLNSGIRLANILAVLLAFVYHQLLSSNFKNIKEKIKHYNPVYKPVNEGKPTNKF